MDSDPTTRVADFLDDKLQATSDLGSLDALLGNITTQHGLLKKQLDDAQRRLHDAQQAAQAHSSNLQQHAAAFRSDQADIDRRLMVITASETSDDAVPRFEAVLETLDRMDVAIGYLESLAEVDVLSKEARSQLDTSNEAALPPYKQLRSLHTRLVYLHGEAEGAAPQLLHHVDRITQVLRTKILDAFSADLQSVLKKIRWPTAKATIPSQMHEEWETAIVKLLDLQMPELEGASYASGSTDKVKLPPVLFPFAVLVQPLELRFHYHFDGDKPTNRLDKPEFFLAHITSLLNDYSDFVGNYVQPVLLKHFRGTDLALNSVFIDAMSAFITALLPMLRSKITALLNEVKNSPQLLSHLMHELMTFDNTIRDDWGYDGGYGINGWKGLSWEFLQDGNWFGRWLQVEQDFALSRYQNIVEAQDFDDLDYESVDPNATKPTKGVIRVNDLLETITDRYRHLTSFNHKITFLMEIQIAIFDKLYKRMCSKLDAWSMAFGFLGGATKETMEELLGMSGLERLCQIFGSADFLEKAMRDWSDDVFFLDLYEELQDRAQRGQAIGGMSVADVAERMSRSVEEEGDGGSPFDETAGHYAELREKSEKTIVETLNKNVGRVLQPFLRLNSWATISGSSTGSLSPTAELDSLLTYLTSALEFLSKALASAPLRRISRAVLTNVSNDIWSKVIMAHRFSTTGSAQLHTDLDAICRVVNAAVGSGVSGVGEAGLRKCLEGVQLIGLPVKGSREDTARTFPESTSKSAGTAQGNADGEDAWDAWDADADDGGDLPLHSPESDGSADEPQKASAGSRDTALGAVAQAADLGLWEVESRLFADNSSARQVLDVLGLEVMSEQEARELIKKRVELDA